MTHDILYLILEISGAVAALTMVGSLMFAWATGAFESLARNHAKSFYRNGANK